MSINHYELFIFDFDGTLADSRINIANSVNKALAEKGFPKVKNQAIFPTIGKIPIQSVFRRFYPNLSEQEVLDLTLLFRKYLIGNAKHELTLFPEVEKTLRALHDKNILLAILTTKHTEVINEILAAFGLASLFSVIYGSGLSGGNKPDKGCVEYILNELDGAVTPEQTVMIGDTSIDLETATNSHIDSIGVTYGIDGDTITKLGFTYTINSFDELLRFAL